MNWNWGRALLLGLSCLLSTTAWAGGECEADGDCGPGAACEAGACMDCVADLDVEACVGAPRLRGHACWDQVVAALRMGAGLCAGRCEVQRTLALCTDDDFLNSPCGVLELEAWDADLEAYAPLPEDGGGDGDLPAPLPDEQITSECFRVTQGWAPDTEEADVIVPEGVGDAGETIGVQREVYGREGQAFTGFSSHYYGLRMQDMTRASSAAPGEGALDPPDEGVEQRRAWEQNEDRVEGCAEYIYESYYSYSRFEDAIRTLGDDYRAIWAVAYANAPPLPPDRDGRVTRGPALTSIGAEVGRFRGFIERFIPTPISAIGTRAMAGVPMAARNGDPVQPQPRMEDLGEPNPWFRGFPLGFAPPSERAWPDEFPEIYRDCGVELSRPVICDAALRAELNAAIEARGQVDTTSFEWHYRKGLALEASGVLDEELLQFQHLADRLAHLQARRAALLWELFRRLPDPSEAIPEVQQALPDFGALTNDPTFLAGLDGLRPLGASQVSAKAAEFSPRPTVSQGVGDGLGRIFRRADAVVGLRGDPLRLFNFGLNPPSQATSAPGSGPGGPRTGNDHLAAARGPLVPGGAVSDLVQRALLARVLIGLYEVDRRLEVLVAEALALGCFDNDDDNPCEWTPKMFAETALALYGEREALYQRCLDETAEDGFAAMIGRSFEVHIDRDEPPKYPWFRSNPGREPAAYTACFSPPGGERIELPGYPGGLDVGAEIDVLDPDCDDCNDWARDTTHVTAFLKCAPRWENLLLKMVQEEIPELLSEEGGQLVARLRQRVGEWWQVGNDRFGAYAGYGFGWAIGGFDEYVAADGREALRCELAPEVYGHFDLAATLFSKDIGIIDASGHLRFGDNPSTFEGGLPRTPGDRLTVEPNYVDVEVLGRSIYREPLEADADGFNIVSGSESYDQDIFSASAVFPLGPIPVSVAAGLAGEVGMAFDVGGEFPAFNQPGCTLAEARGTVSPFVGVNAFASVSVNAVIAEVGVKIQLVLMRLDLPFIASLALDLRPGAEVTMAARMQLDLVLTILSGRVLLFARVAWETFEKVLFGWDGPRFSTNLFDLDAEVPLFSLARVINELNREGL